MLFPRCTTLSLGVIIPPLDPVIIRRDQRRSFVIICKQPCHADDLRLVRPVDVQMEPAVDAIPVAEYAVIICRFLVGAYHPLVIAKHHLVHGPCQQVIGKNRYLSPAPGRIEHVPRDGKPAGMADEVLHDLDTLGDRCAEMADTLGKVALVQVVRPDTVLHELRE